MKIQVLVVLREKNTFIVVMFTYLHHTAIPYTVKLFLGLSGNTDTISSVAAINSGLDLSDFPVLNRPMSHVPPSVSSPSSTSNTGGSFVGRASYGVCCLYFQRCMKLASLPKGPYRTDDCDVFCIVFQYLAFI
jgi:hypothetical protein